MSCTFSIFRLNETEYANGQVPSAICQEALQRVSSIKDLLSLPDKDITRFFQRHFLRKSAHQGQLLGFLNPCSGLKFALDEIKENIHDMIGREVRLILEYQDLDTDLLVQHLQARQRSMPSPLSEQVTESLAQDLAWTSDAIEGTTVEAFEARDVFAAEASSQLTDDQYELKQHYHVIRKIILDHTQSVDEAFMLKVHRALDLTNLDDNDKGHYRRVNVTIRGETNPGFSAWQNVPAECQQLFAQLADKNPIEWSIWLHFQFVQIHPFRDGNGRVARLLMNAVLVRSGYPLVAIQPGIRDLYFHSLRHIRQHGDFRLLRRIVAESMLRSLDLINVERLIV